jgi:phage protein D
MPATDTDLPAFEVKVDGTALEPLVAADVIELDVHEEVNRHARLTLLMQNWDPDRRAVRHSDDGPFRPGAAIELALGYHANLIPVFQGKVSALTAHFPAASAPTLRVEARSKSILLEHPPRSRQFDQSTDADVANAIAADYSLTADAADGVTRDAVVSDRQSDWDFLKARARELGWVTYVRGDSLVLRPPNGDEPQVELAFTQSLVECHLTQDITRAVDSVVGVAWDIASLEASEAEEGAASADVKLGGRAGHDTAIGDAGWPLRTEHAESPGVAANDAADAIAVGHQRRTALGHYFGSGVTHGDPAIRCDQWITISGVGTRLSGPHYVSAARHRLSADGYRTEFQLGLPPALAPAAEHTRQPGLVLAIVESLDDPDSANRVKVRLPWRKDDGGGVWARISTLDAGDGFGTVFVPRTGQEVLVGFVDGAADHPVVLGSLHNGTQAPPITIDPDANAIRTIVTPGGHTITLDDESPLISLTSGNGHSVVVDDSNSKIVLTHKDSSNAVTVSADGIELNASQGDIVLKASGGAVKLDSMTIEGKASGPSKIESSATFDLTASGSLGLKGALVKIN